MTQLIVQAHSLSKRFLLFRKEKSFVRLFKNYREGKSSYQDYLGLDNLTFDIVKGDKVALIGGNGAGKTTLLRILAGIFPESSGTLHTQEVPVAFFRFWIGSSRELSVLESIRLLSAIYGISSENLKDDAEKILQMAELEEQKNTAVKVLSSGQYQRLALSVFFHVQSNFIIFDEGLTYLDTKFLHKCEKYFEELSSSSKTVILTSHDNRFLRKYCQSAIWLEHGKLKMQGSIDTVITAYEATL